MAKSNKKRTFIIIGVVVLLIIILVVGSRGGLTGRDSSIKVELSEAQRVRIVEKVSASGSIQPITEVKLAADVSGEIISLKVQEGDSVTAGTVLAQLKPDNLESVLERAQANLRQMRANLAESKAREARAIASLERARMDYNRQKDLYGRKVISDADWQQTEANFKIAYNDSISAHQTVKANTYMVQSAEASVSEAKENLDLTTIIAPMSGIISKLNVEQGERVVGTQQMAGTEMLRIADLNAMEVRVDVNENDIIRISQGDTVEIDVDAYNDRLFKGIVTAIANTANDKVSADAVTEFEVRIRILNSSYADLAKAGNPKPFRPGMTASVDIITDVKKDALAVPLAAVTTRLPGEKREKEGRRYGPPQEEDGDDKGTKKKKEDPIEVVFVDSSGVAIMVPVKTGISDYDNIQILSGLKEGDNVVSGPFKVISKDLFDDDKIVEKEERGERE